MKKKIFLKKYIIAIAFILFIFFVGNKVEAASLSIKSSKSSVSAGGTATITVSSSYTGSVNLTVSGGELSDSVIWLENDSQSVTVTADKNASKVTVTATPSEEMSDSEGNLVTVSGASTSISVSSSSSSNTNTTSSTNTTTSNNTTSNTTTEEPTFTSVEETVYSTGNINVRKSYSTDSDIIGQLQTGESVTRVGVGSNGWSKVNYNGETGYIKTSLLTTEEPTLSSDATLQTLEITQEGLSPEFSSDVTSYTLIVGTDVDKLDIITSPTDENATVEISGNESFKIGENEVNIIVTAEDGTTNTYTISVIKQETSQLGLASLKIDGYTLSPTFSVNTYEYKINVLDPNVTELNITATANDTNATIKISGNTNLQKGDNTVTVTVTSEDGTETVIYQIKVNKTSEATTTDNNLYKYIAIGIIIFIILLIITILIIKNRKKKEYDYTDENDDSDDYSDLYGYASRNKNTIDNEKIDSSLENTEKQNEAEPQDQELSNKFDTNNIDNIYDNSLVKNNLDDNNYTDTFMKDNLNANNYTDTFVKDNLDTNNYTDTFVKDNLDTNIYNDTVLNENKINNSVNEVNNNVNDDFNKYTNVINDSDKTFESLNPYVTKDIYGDNNNAENQSKTSYNNQYDDFTIDDNYKFKRSKGKH